MLPANVAFFQYARITIDLGVLNPRPVVREVTQNVSFDSLLYNVCVAQFTSY